jgi:hypothetical protein
MSKEKSILDYNINLFLDNITKKYNINRDELESLKDYNHTYIETTINTVKKIYEDNEENQYILLDKVIPTQNDYYAIKIKKI